MLGLRCAPKEYMQSSSAELVYGQTLRVPGEFIPTASVPWSAAGQRSSLLETARTFAPVPTSQHSNPAFRVSPGLLSADFIFIRHKAHRGPLRPPYDGPFRVIRHRDKSLVVDVGGRPETVSRPLELALPPRRGRPPMARPLWGCPRPRWRPCPCPRLRPRPPRPLWSVHAGVGCTATQLSGCRSADFVFIRHDADRGPLRPPYDGPFRVIRHRDKSLVVDVGDRPETVSVDRIKPAHVDVSRPLELALPTRRGRPTMARPPRPLWSVRAGVGWYFLPGTRILTLGEYWGGLCGD
nr:PREDICTED: uncharacterized protein LOC104945814 [Notothenia coriiceps]